MLPADGGTNHRGAEGRKGGAPHDITLRLDTFEHAHDDAWLDSGDRVQAAYEKARSRALDARRRIPERLEETLCAHGLAGLLLDPQHTLPQDRPPSRRGRAGTAFHQTRLPEEKFTSIATALAEGVGVNAAARIFGASKKSVLYVLARAAAHAGRLSRGLLQDLVITECQLDELWSFIGKKQHNLEGLEALGSTLGDAWIWIAFDAVTKVVPAHVVGKRTTPHAVELIRAVERATASMPALFSSDQLDAYTHALLNVYGHVETPPCRPGGGRPPKPRLVPPEDLCYVQVVKRYEGRRVAEVRRRIVFGDPERVEHLLQQSPVSRTINTSYVERNNATVRHMDARCGRKTYRFSRCKINHERQLILSLAYYHLCRPHRTLTAKHQGPTTPFMAAGLTDRVWSMRELLQSHAANACA